MSPSRLARVESATRTVLEYQAAFNRRDTRAIEHLISEDCTYESADPAPSGMVYKGKTELINYWQNKFRECPHAFYEIEDIFGIGNHCVIRWIAGSTETNGKKDSLRGIELFEVRNGHIYRIYSYVKA